jgi:low temperature requirement protein LtrA
VTTSRPPRILRKDGQPEYPTFLELFYDLVYVFMLARLSAGLASDLSARNALQTTVLLLAAWWVWVLTAWLTDIFDPQLPVIQALVLLVMLGTLVMAIAVPRAFDDEAVVFVAAYYGIQFARAAVLIPGTRDDPYVQARSVRVFVWFLISAGPWVGGAFAEGVGRLVLWVVAVAVDLGSARIGWPVPRLGSTNLSSQVFTGPHLGERHRQIFNIALGELILSAGTGLAFSGFRAGSVAVCAVAFANAAALFLLYFHRIKELLAPETVSAMETARPGTSTSYSHLVMIAGVVAVSAGTSRAIDRPFGAAPTALILTILAGPALFLAGSCLFDYVVSGRILWARLVAVAVLAAAGPGIRLLPPLAIMAVANLVLLVTLAGELAAAHRRPVPAASGPASG